MRSDLQTAPGVVTTVALQDGALVTGTTQDCTPYAERAKAMHNEGRHGSSDMRLAASVPMVLVESYLNRCGIEMSDFVASPEHQRRFLNDPALSHFRVWKGRV
jgi:hypothetical protein